MKRWILLFAIATMLGSQCGCGGRGMAYTRSERLHRASVIMQYDLRQYADDVDLFWLNDQNLRLTKWRIE
jgi:hypothetical protein